MSTPAFAPGPWGLTDTHSNYVFDVVRIGTRDVRVGNEADAHLIAAAPTMYEALEKISEYWNRDQNETPMADALWHIIETCEEALAKARGES